jgi:hypothetical protein
VAEEEVKVVVTQETKGTALKDAQRDAEKLQQATAKPAPASPPASAPPAAKVSAASSASAGDTAAKINELRAEAEKQRGYAERSALKFGFNDVTARTARAQASALEREANRLERPINAAQKAAQKEERDAQAAALREQRAAQKLAAAEEHAAARVSVRETTQEKRRAAAEERAAKTQETHAETRRQRFGRAGMQLGMEAAQGGSLSGGIGSMASAIGPAGIAGIAAVGAVAVGTIVEQLTKDYVERQGIALRDQAARKMNAHGLAIGAGWRGTAGQSQAEEFALQQRMAEREANRPELERQGKRNWYNPLRWFGSSQTWEGQRNLDENDKAQKRDAEQLEKQKEQTRKKFHEEEGGIEMDHARHRAERSQSGQRAAFVDEQKKAWLERYRGLRGAGATDAEAAQTAGLEAETRMRDRQVAAGSGLVDARSGAGDIAAAARWAGMSTPGMAEVAAAIGALHGTVRDSSQKAEEANKHIDQSVK